jgi:hypothetical protein
MGIAIQRNQRQNEIRSSQQVNAASATSKPLPDRRQRKRQDHHRQPEKEFALRGNRNQRLW